MPNTPQSPPTPSTTTSSSSSSSIPPNRRVHRREIPDTPINFEAIRNSRQRQADAILNATVPPSLPRETYGRLFDQMLAQQENDELTYHLGLPALVELGNALMRELRSIPRRGAQYSLSAHDSLVVYLLWLSTPATQVFLARAVSIHQSTFSRCVDMVRPALNEYLKQRFANPPRPTINPLFPFPEVALLVDATTVTIPTPALTFEERKEYYDGHHRCYSLKIEVAVNPRPPHQALFISDVVKGSVHDVALFRMGIDRYSAYLRKQPEELTALPADMDFDSFAIMADKGYIGQFPGIRIITPIKRTRLPPSFPPSAAISIPPSFPAPSPPPERNSHHPLPQTTTTSSSSSTSFTPAHASASATPTHYYSTPSLRSPRSPSSPEGLVDSTQASPATDAIDPDADFNVSVARTRIPVEWFFGRMKKIWMRLALKYSGDRDKLSADLQNACYLTNISIFHKMRCLKSELMKLKLDKQPSDNNLDK